MNVIDIFRTYLRRVTPQGAFIDMESPVIPILRGSWYTQRVSLRGVRELVLRFATYGRTNDCSLEMALHDENGTIIGQRILEGKTLVDNGLYTVRLWDEIKGDGETFISVRSQNGCAGNNLGIWREKGIGGGLIVRPSGPLNLKENPGIQSTFGGGFALGLHAALGGCSYRRPWATLPPMASANVLLLVERVAPALPEPLLALTRRKEVNVSLAYIGEGWPQLQPDLLLVPSSINDKAARAAALTAHRLGVPVVHVDEASDGKPRWKYFADTVLTLPPSPGAADLQAVWETLGKLVQPAISVVLPMSGIKAWGQAVLASYAAQSYQGPIELVFVGRAEDATAAEWVRQRINEATTLHPRAQAIRCEFVFDGIATPNTLWSLGAKAAAGELLMLSDAGITAGVGMLQAHVDTLSYHDCELSIGCVSDDPEPQEHGMRMAISMNRDRINCESFVNCRAGNITLRRTREVLDVISKAADYGLRPDWQSVAIGFNTYLQGGRIKFSTDALAFRHASVPAASPSDDLAALRTLGQHLPEFQAVTRRWQKTYVDEQLAHATSVSNGCDKEAKGATLAKAPMRSMTTRPLRIITYRWHVPHQYELYKLPHQFDLMIGLGARISESWDLGQRPMPANARFISPEQFNESDYDLAILHFDENVLSHENTNGQLGEEWGANFRWFMENLKLPKVAICHGTPQFHGQYNPDYSGSDLMTTIEPARQRLVDYLKDVEVVCNSHQAYGEWQFRKSRVIWHGFDPTEFPPTQYAKGILSPLGPLVTSRPHYRGYFLYQQVFNETYPREFLPSQLSVVDPHVDYSGNVFALAKFRNYVNELRNYSVYFNPTLRSPMPRARGEPMMCGVVTVNANNHDVDLFIKNGVNGFYSNDPDELREQLLYLMRNPEATRKIGAEARKTAMDVFNHDRYLSEWSALIQSVV